MKLTIDLGPSVTGKLKTLEQRLNRKLAPKVERELGKRISKEQIAIALIKIGLALRSEDPLVFKVMVELHEMAHD